MSKKPLLKMSDETFCKWTGLLQVLENDKHIHILNIGELNALRKWLERNREHITTK